MSRIGNNPINIPSKVEVSLLDGSVVVKGPKGSLDLMIPDCLNLEQNDSVLRVLTKDQSKKTKALSGTIRALLANNVKGVSDGFFYELEVIGVGYRAQTKGKILNLALGFSHPVDFPIPEGIEITTPSQTEIIVKGIDKQLVGQVAANIRAFRKPEPYKGKGIRYKNEQIVKKEAKKA
ncbi:MAG: 50S ribosomal protein L6 [Methylococcaceae bacterium TMED69]|nr:MAG: 50S ribosomal protein L6 [Methylococcaceae bacterium TMED69]|tara:strand:+ start:153 stop:686 length:534 start_codon:yes stop_codon:yes gene_type:complete